MENRIIKTALISVLSYLVFKKIYDILNELLLWASVLFRVENNFIFLFLNILIGLISLLILLLLHKQYLNEKGISTKTIYKLLFLTIFFTIIGLGISRFHSEYLSQIAHLDGFDMKYLFQFTWAKTMDSVFPIIGLLYFLWKINKNSKHEF